MVTYRVKAIPKPGVYQLFGNNGRVAYATDQTVVEPGLDLEIGTLVEADLAKGTALGLPASLATRVWLPGSIKPPLPTERFAPLTLRLLAKSWDLVMALGIGFLVGRYSADVLGLAAALAWLGLSDRATGTKHYTGLIVVHPDGRPCSLKASFVRNLPIMLGASLFFWLAMVAERPGASAWTAAFVLLGVVAGLEAVAYSQSDFRRRFGDRWADTRVINPTG